MNYREDDRDEVREFLEQEDGYLPLDSPDAATNADEALAENAVPGGSAPLEIAFSEHASMEELLTEGGIDERNVASLEANLRIEPSARDLPPSPQEIVFGKSPSPGGLNVGFQPHARRQPIQYEPQPSFETPEDAPGIIRGLYRPGEDNQSIQDFVHRPDDPEDQPRVQLFSDSRATQSPSAQAAAAGNVAESSGSSPERGQTLPRMLVTVSMASARSVFQECIERASQSLGAKFHNACQSTVNDYARERRAAERAASRWGR